MQLGQAEVEHVLERFTSGVAEAVDPVAVWAHGSLGAGDFQPGRSDLDLIVVVDEPLAKDQTRALTAFHELLHREEPAAEKLHCSYVALTEVADPEVIHFTWAHGEVYPRTVTPVTRCELQRAPRVFQGPPPSEVLPETSDEELLAFVRESLAGYWAAAARLRKRNNWRKDIWVDLGMLTYARSVVTLRDGRLITKREALDELARLGAPADVVEDIRARRYGAEPAADGRPWLRRRGRRARRFVRAGIRRTLAEG
jgi:hypothetical protein